MEFHRLHALVHDRISSFMRRMDREYVGLYVRWRRLLHSILPRYRSDRQSSRKYRDDLPMVDEERLQSEFHSLSNRFSIFS